MHENGTDIASLPTLATLIAWHNAQNSLIAPESIGEGAGSLFAGLPGHPPIRLLAPSPIDSGAIREFWALCQAIRVASLLSRELCGFFFEFGSGLPQGPF